MYSGSRSFSVFLFALLLLVSLATASEFIDAPPLDPGYYPEGVLVDNSQAHATLIISADASNLIKHVTADLQKVLYDITGVVLPVATDDWDVFGNRVLIGQTQFTDSVVSPAEIEALGKEGFIVRTQGRDLALTGPGSYGPAHAVAEIYELLGARWYMPGDLGACLPSLDRVAFEDLDVTETPSFEQRWVGRHFDWSWRNRTNRIDKENMPRGFYAYPRITHTQHRILPVSEYFEEHPEYYSLVDGERLGTDKTKLCNSNPEVAEAIDAHFKDSLRADPSIDMVVLVPTDGQNWCQCEDCLAMDEENAPRSRRYSRRQLILYNRVAELLEDEFPDVTLLGGAYNVYTEPPEDPSLQAHKNVAVWICHYNAYCVAHPIADPECPRNQKYLKLIEGWKEKGVAGMSFLEYYHKDNWLGLPWPLVHSIREDIPFYKSVGAIGVKTRFQRSSMWGDFLNHYIAAQLLWDVDVNVDELLEEFYENFFGEAAVPMKHYHKRLEDAMAEVSSCFPGNAGSRSHWLLSVSLLKDLKDDLSEAESLAQNANVKERLERYRSLIEYSEQVAKQSRLRVIILLPIDNTRFQVF